MAAFPINIGDTDRILIIAPHPDDECIGVGGILAQYPYICDVVVITDGSQGGLQGYSPEKVKAIRTGEFEEEMKYLGVNSYVMLGYEDGTLMKHLDCLKDVDFSRYSKIFVPCKDDNHPDHTAAFWSAMKYMQNQNITAEVYQYEVHGPMHDVTHMVDVTEVMEEKMQLIRIHRSQLAGAYDERARSLGKYRACQNKMTDKFIETYLKTDMSKEQSDDIASAREAALEKYIQFYRVMTKWIDMKLSNKRIVDYLEKHNYKSVSIYGFSDLGKLLYKELLSSAVEVVNILDNQYLKNNYSDLKVCVPKEGTCDVDCVIVTAIYYYNEIEAQLKGMGYKNVLSLQKIVEEIDK